MKIYNIYWYDSYGNKSLMDITTDVDKWLADNNENRIDEGNELEELSDFEIEEVTASIYSKEK